MPIGMKFLPVLTADERTAVEKAIDSLVLARDGVAVAVDYLRAVKPLIGEADKLASSRDSLTWERRLIEDRLKSLLDQGKRIGGCVQCGCRLDGEGRCAACSTGSPSEV